MTATLLVLSLFTICLVSACLVWSVLCLRPVPPEPLCRCGADDPQCHDCSREIGVVD